MDKAARPGIAGQSSGSLNDLLLSAPIDLTVPRVSKDSLTIPYSFRSLPPVDTAIAIALNFVI